MHFLFFRIKGTHVGADAHIGPIASFISMADVGIGPYGKSVKELLIVGILR